MTARDLLATLGKLGIAATVNGDKLLLDGPNDALTDELIEAVRRHKPEIIRALADCRHPHHEPSHWLDHEPVDHRIRTTCRWCGRFIGYRNAEPSRN